MRIASLCLGLFYDFHVCTVGVSVVPGRSQKFIAELEPLTGGSSDTESSPFKKEEAVLLLPEEGRLLRFTSRRGARALARRSWMQCNERRLLLDPIPSRCVAIFLDSGGGGD